MSEPNALRFSLRVLLIAVAVVALGAFALRSASEVWVSIVVTFMVGVLLFAVLAAIYRQGAARAFWVGLAVCGWAYILCVFGPLQGVSSRLLTTKLLYYAAERTAPALDARATMALPSVATPTPYAAPVPAPSSPTVSGFQYTFTRVLPAGAAPQSIRSAVHRQSFVPIGQALWTLLFGFMGGIVARVLYSRRQPAEA